MSDRQQAAITIPLDEESLVRLMGLSRHCGRPITALAAELLRDILKDDEEAHFLTSARAPTNTLN